MNILYKANMRIRIFVLFSTPYLIMLTFAFLGNIIGIHAFHEYPSAKRLEKESKYHVDIFVMLLISNSNEIKVLSLIIDCPKNRTGVQYRNRMHSI